MECKHLRNQFNYISLALKEKMKPTSHHLNKHTENMYLEG